MAKSLRYLVSCEQLDKIDEEMTAIKAQLHRKGGSLYNPEAVLRVLREITKPKIPDGTGKLILQLLSGDEILKIGECDGSKTLSDDENLILSNDLVYENFGTTQSIATEEMLFDVYQWENSATLGEAFSSLAGHELRKLLTGEHQASVFCKKYPHWLSKTHPTFFLLSNDVVARIFWRHGKLLVYKDRFTIRPAKTFLWGAGARLVIPKW